MSRTTRLAVVAAVLSTLLLGAGCTSVVAGSPAADPGPVPTEGPGSDPVAWADRVCGSLLTFTRPALNEPDFTSSSDLPAIKQVLSEYLGSIVTGIQQSLSELGGVGRSPVTGGDEAVTRIDGVLRQLELDISTAKGKVDAADPNDPNGFQAALSEAEATLNEITAPDALGDLGALPRLDKAAERSANCQQLGALGTGG
ncbi:hypothetical protein ACVGVM_01470 [Pseudonocardia bannensis]|uniref:Uncharacterized protein n=1 Tax=Pseudonocardia bannensis TaxID=630973 RepID=A0A848DDI7_9PSEU|nr:hypothetical protein [Pseudonocardia bannensis]NMH90661.1 hypothetical protein [Pseudonocardia bannensis]